MNCTVCSGELVATGTPKHSWWVCIDCKATFPWEFNASAVGFNGTAFTFKGFNIVREEEKRDGND